MIYDLRLTICTFKPFIRIVNRKSSIVNDIVAGRPFSSYINPVNRLTKQEQLVLCIVLGLLLTGWAVKTYRTAHPPAGSDLSRPNLKMQEINFDEAVEQILAKDPRYARDAYLFVREALDFTQKARRQGNPRRASATSAARNCSTASGSLRSSNSARWW